MSTIDSFDKDGTPRAFPSSGLPSPAKMAYDERGGAISAAVAQQLYTLLVGGSNPSSPTSSLKP